MCVEEFTAWVKMIERFPLCSPVAGVTQGTSRCLGTGPRAPSTLGRFEWIQSGPLSSSDLEKSRDTQKELQETQTQWLRGWCGATGTSPAHAPNRARSRSVYVCVWGGRGRGRDGHNQHKWVARFYASVLYLLSTELLGSLSSLRTEGNRFLWHLATVSFVTPLFTLGCRRVLPILSTRL